MIYSVMHIWLSRYHTVLDHTRPFQIETQWVVPSL